MKIISDGPEELVDADDLTNICESLDGRLKGGLEANVSKKKKMIRIENAGKVTEEGNFLCAVSSKDVGSNSILCQFSRWWVQKRCSNMRDILKENSRFKCHTCANQQTDILEECPGIKLNSKVIKYLKERKVSRGLSKDRNAWNSFIRNCPTHKSKVNIH